MLLTADQRPLFSGSVASLDGLNGSGGKSTTCRRSATTALLVCQSRLKIADKVRFLEKKKCADRHVEAHAAIPGRNQPRSTGTPRLPAPELPGL
jgi:hypothetical protein